MHACACHNAEKLQEGDEKKKERKKDEGVCFQSVWEYMLATDTHLTNI